MRAEGQPTGRRVQRDDSGLEAGCRDGAQQGSVRARVDPDPFPGPLADNYGSVVEEELRLAGETVQLDRDRLGTGCDIPEREAIIRVAPTGADGDQLSAVVAEGDIEVDIVVAGQDALGLRR